jgi:non-heme chloroperoxidase
MSASLESALELISVRAENRTHSTPLLFVHGAYAGAWCWAEHFLPWFAAQGWDAYAVSLTGHGESPGAEYLDTLSIDDYVSDLRVTLASFAQPPVVIGHSMGGFVVQKYLDDHDLPGVVLLCSVPPAGLAGSALGLALQRPGLLVDLTRIAGGSNISSQTLVKAMFHQPLPELLLERYFSRFRRESQRAVWDMLGFNLPRIRRNHCKEVMVLGAHEDSLISEAAVRWTAAAWGVKPVMAPDIGHGVMLETGWRAIAQTLEDWLAPRFR